MFARTHAVSAGGVAGRYIAGKLSGTQRQCMQAGRPRSRVGASSRRSCLSSGQAAACRAHVIPAGGVAGRYIAGKLSGTLRQCMRAGR
ncbi:MAG: hypothetical protein OXI92_17795, partial [Acidobacteriota bacterium]|nr:hypothetical protein [Acidobacteriota bacterium]